LTVLLARFLAQDGKTLGCIEELERSMNDGSKGKHKIGNSIRGEKD
jgi:hypothetical protein